MENYKSLRQEKPIIDEFKGHQPQQIPEIIMSLLFLRERGLLQFEMKATCVAFDSPVVMEGKEQNLRAFKLYKQAKVYKV